MGIARPLHLHQLKTVEDCNPTIEPEPASIQLGKEAFQQSSTNAFLRSVDEWLWSKPTEEEWNAVCSDFSPAQGILFVNRYHLIEAKRQKIWDDLCKIKKYHHKHLPKARQLVEQDPKIDPVGISDIFTRVIVATILKARHWLLDESLVFDDHDETMRESNSGDPATVQSIATAPEDARDTEMSEITENEDTMATGQSIEAEMSESTESGDENRYSTEVAAAALLLLQHN